MPLIRRLVLGCAMGVSASSTIAHAQGQDSPLSVSVSVVAGVIAFPSGLAIESDARRYDASPRRTLGASVELRPRGSSLAYRLDVLRATGVTLNRKGGGRLDPADQNAVESVLVSVVSSPTFLCRTRLCLYAVSGVGTSLYTVNAVELVDDYAVEIANQHQRRFTGRLAIGATRSISRVPVALEIGDAVTRGLDGLGGADAGGWIHQLVTTLRVGYRFSK